MIKKAGFIAGCFVVLAALFSASTALSAERLTPVEELKASDMPYDAGGVILLTWKAMSYDDPPDPEKKKKARVEYITYISRSEKGPWIETAKFPSNTKYKSDKKLPFWAWNKTKDYHCAEIQVDKHFPGESEGKSKGKSEVKSKGKTEKEIEKEAKKIKRAKYFFKVVSSSRGGQAESEIVSAKAKGNWFSLPKLNNLLFTAIFCAILLWFISHAKKKDLFLRRIPGLDAVDDAIGRATEMGRPIFFLTGRMDIDNISTIAATLILGEVAKKVAAYDTRLMVPHTYPMPMAICQEVTKQAYSQAGRPDSYREDINFFVTEDQFAYTAAVNGMMVREKPAACFYMGYYYAESLLLAEVGSSVGAIQIAGTDAEHQLPFFFLTCDYTLIGEELYAAGGYLSREPVLVGTIRGQDAGKFFTMGAILLGVILSTCGVIFGFEKLATLILEPFTSY